MDAYLPVALEMVALHRRFLDGSVQSLGLTIRSGMVLGETVLDVMLSQDLIKAMNPKAGRPAIAIARQISELCAVVG